MQRLLLFDSDNRKFSVSMLQEIFESERGFDDVRYSEPGGAAIEAEYSQGDDSTIVRLSGDRETISLSGVSDAALNVALILQRRLEGTLRIIDADYTFDLVLAGLSSLSELRSAIKRAQAT